MAEIPHLAVPLQFANKNWVVVEQDTEEEVAQCVRNICAFERGYRVEDPDFGIVDPTFTTMPIDAGDIAQALEDYEERAQVDIFQEITPDGRVSIRLEVQVPTSEEATNE
jgi:phage baseplate assembly protein W